MQNQIISFYFRHLKPIAQIRKKLKIRTKKLHTKKQTRKQCPNFLAHPDPVLAKSVSFKQKTGNQNALNYERRT